MGVYLNGYGISGNQWERGRGCICSFVIWPVIIHVPSLEEPGSLTLLLNTFHLSMAIHRPEGHGSITAFCEQSTALFSPPASCFIAYSSQLYNLQGLWPWFFLQYSQACFLSTYMPCWIRTLTFTLEEMGRLVRANILTISCFVCVRGGRHTSIHACVCMCMYLYANMYAYIPCVDKPRYGEDEFNL